jgi:hypothetical protein
VHTPDSSRYWIAASYEERQRQGLEPENIDKVCHFDFLPIVIDFYFYFVFASDFFSLLIRIAEFENINFLIRSFKVPIAPSFLGNSGFFSYYLHFIEIAVSRRSVELQEFLRLWFKSKCDPYNDKVREARH